MFDIILGKSLMFDIILGKSLMFDILGKSYLLNNVDLKSLKFIIVHLFFKPL